ncbi:MAG: DUF1822 family protein [Cyanobacteria bacterium Co-bin8]|nr:DUF1822 family protein [Cyanobacteria bacterium Co-bin8]
MSYPDDATTFSVPLALTAHTQAERFRQQHANPVKAKQVYLNTLAVYAVNFYLDCLAIDTDLAHSKSWNPIQQTLLDTADLLVNHRGCLECRPVLPEATTLNVPTETHQDRIGYVAVQLDRDLRQATLLGFLASVSTERVPLEQLQPLETLAEHLEKCAAVAPVGSSETGAATVPESQSPPIASRLSQWLQNLAAAGWQTVEQALTPQQPAFGFRGERPLEADTPPVVQRRKQIQLPEAEGSPIQLTIGLSPLPESEMEIWVQVSPTGDQRYLPPHLHLLVLDDLDTEVMQAEARSTEAIRLRFTGTIGEQFSLKLTLGNTSMIEAFVI